MFPFVATARVICAPTTGDCSSEGAYPADLPTKGIPWSREHTRRMWKAGRFPKPFKMSVDGIGWNYWDEAAVDEWLAERARPPARAPKA